MCSMLSSSQLAALEQLLFSAVPDDLLIDSCFLIEVCQLLYGNRFRRFWLSAGPHDHVPGYGVTAYSPADAEILLKGAARLRKAIEPPPQVVDVHDDTDPEWNSLTSGVHVPAAECREFWYPISDDW